MALEPECGSLDLLHPVVGPRPPTGAGKKRTSLGKPSVDERTGGDAQPVRLPAEGRLVQPQTRTRLTRQPLPSMWMSSLTRWTTWYDAHFDRASDWA